MTTTQLGEHILPVFRPAQNNTGAAIAKYLVVKMVPAEAPHGVVVTAAATDIPYGVTIREGIAASGGVSDAVKTGATRVTASGAIAAGARIAPAANGKVKAAAGGEIVMGQALDEALADGDVIMAEIDCAAPVLL